MSLFIDLSSTFPLLYISESDILDMGCLHSIQAVGQRVAQSVEYFILIFPANLEAECIKIREIKQWPRPSFNTEF